MKLCYVDESGKAEMLVEADGQQQPVIVIGGVALPEERLTDITHEWIELKARFHPGHLPRGQKGWLDGILNDVKGPACAEVSRRVGRTGNESTRSGSLMGR